MLERLIFLGFATYMQLKRMINLMYFKNYLFNGKFAMWPWDSNDLIHNQGGVGKEEHMMKWGRPMLQYSAPAVSQPT